MRKDIKHRIKMIQRGEIPAGYKLTPLGVIPKEWEVKRLGELGELFRGKGIPKSKITREGVGCVTYGEIYTTYNYTFDKFQSFTDYETAKDSVAIRKNDILFAGSGETLEEIGKCVAYLGDEEAFAGGDIVVFRPKNVDGEVLGYLLNQDLVNQQKYKLGQGHSVVHIYAKNLETIMVPVFKNKEQRAIAKIASTWNEAIMLKERLIEKKQDQKKALMQKLLTGETRLPGFDEKWEEVRLGDLGELYQPQTISQRQLKNAGYPVFGANGLIGYYDMYNHENWQTLITCRGSTCGTVNRSLPKSWITGNAMVFNVDESNHVDKEFAYYLCLNQDFSRIISGSGQPQITRAPLVNYRVTIPTNKEEQIRIREIIATIDKEMQLLTKELELVKRQKKGLMQLLLTGIVRVKEVVL